MHKNIFISLFRLVSAKVLVDSDGTTKLDSPSPLFNQSSKTQESYDVDNAK